MTVVHTGHDGSIGNALLWLHAEFPNAVVRFSVFDSCFFCVQISEIIDGTRYSYDYTSMISYYEALHWCLILWRRWRGKERPGAKNRKSNDQAPDSAGPSSGVVKEPTPPGVGRPDSDVWRAGGIC